MRCCPQQPPCLRVLFDEVRLGARVPAGPFSLSRQACAPEQTARLPVSCSVNGFSLQNGVFLAGHTRYNRRLAEDLCSACGKPLHWLAVWTEHSGGPRCEECVGAYERLDLRETLKRLNRPNWVPCAVCGRKVVDVRRRGQKHFVCSPSCRRRLPAKLRRDARASRRERPAAKACLACDEPLLGRRPDALYCSTACRVWAHRARAVMAA